MLNGRDRIIRRITMLEEFNSIKLITRVIVLYFSISNCQRAIIGCLPPPYPMPALSLVLAAVVYFLPYFTILLVLVVVPPPPTILTLSIIASVGPSSPATSFS